MSNKLIGTGVALVTPFNQDGSIDFASLEKIVNFVIDGGVEYIVVLGTTAESPTLSKEEKEAVKDCITKANNGRIPMVLGIGGNDTADIVKQIQQTDLSNYVAVLSVCPYYNKPSQEGIYQHYKAIASTGGNILLYNVPGRTVSNINAKTTLRLAKEFPNIIALKEASPDYLQSNYVIKDKPKDFLVMSGDDEITLPMVLAGGAGVISVIGQGLPQLFSDMVRLGLDRKVDEAYAIHYKIMDITAAIYDEGNPTGIKALLSIQGLCQPYTRLPLVPASPQLIQKITDLYNQL